MLAMFIREQARSYRGFVAQWIILVQYGQTRQIELAQFAASAIAALDAEAQCTGGMDEGVRTIRRRELFEQQSGVKGLAVQGTEAAHGPDDIFSGKGMGGRVRLGCVRQVPGSEFQEPARHQTGAPQERLNELLLDS
ncbi:MAG: hypothetical protein M0P42_14450 [Gallionella sp.]|nr:hypothetical protein [Gallionella sp.]